MPKPDYNMLTTISQQPRKHPTHNSYLPAQAAPSTMCQFLQVDYACGHIALATHPSSTVHCNAAIIFGLIDKRDGPPAACFPRPEDVTDPAFVEYYHDSANKCHICEGRSASIPGFVYAHAVRSVYIDFDDDGAEVGEEGEEAGSECGGTEKAGVHVHKHTAWDDLELQMKRTTFVTKLDNRVRRAIMRKHGNLAERRGRPKLYVYVYAPQPDECLPLIERDFLPLRIGTF